MKNTLAKVRLIAAKAWKRKREPRQAALSRHERLTIVYKVAAIVGVLVAVIVAFPEVTDRLGDHRLGGANGSLPEIRDLMSEIQVPDRDFALVETMANDFVESHPNLPRESVAEYIGLKKSAISQVRFLMTRDTAQNNPDRLVAEKLLGKGRDQASGYLGVASVSEGEPLAEMERLSDVRLLFRAHWAILFDEPRMAAEHFRLVADRRSQTDTERARNLLADGGDHLSKFGCVQGRSWLTSAASLYESSLRAWPRDEDEIERGFTQNNLGATLLLLGARHLEGEDAVRVLETSVESLRDAASVLVRSWEYPDPRVSIVYRNLDRAIYELVRVVDRSTELVLEPARRANLEQERAVAYRYIIANRTRALTRGGAESDAELEASGTAMQIEPEREPTEARGLRVVLNGNPCRRFW